VIPKTASYSKVKDQAAATRAKLKGEKKAGAAAEEPAGLPNGKKPKVNGTTNGLAAPRLLTDDDPSAQLEMEMRQAHREEDGDVDMTG
jgi:ABC-type uncharacterized transport system YnjBCD ATPase subunit